MQIRAAQDADFEEIWTFLDEVIRTGDSYAFEPDTSKLQAFKLWMQNPRKTFVAVNGGDILGSYYLKTNQAGPGKHVCNCGYIVSTKARGKGLATAMCIHSQEIALDLGYSAMQFNFVAATNTGAIRLWEKLGFNTVGTLPKAFNHPQMGYVNALVMYKELLK